MSKEIEERLLRKIEIEEEITQKQQELVKIIQETSNAKREKKLETNFLKMKFIADEADQKLKSDLYSKFAVYNYFNEENLTNTLLNGLQIESILAGVNQRTWFNFGCRKLGKTYRKPGAFILEFKHLEVF